MATVAKVNLSVSVKEEHLPRFGDVVNELKKTGFEVEQALESLGVVTGSIESRRMSALASVSGVDHVEQSRVVRIPPKESKLQ